MAGPSVYTEHMSIRGIDTSVHRLLAAFVVIAWLAGRACGDPAERWAPDEPSGVLERPLAEVVEQKGAPVSGGVDASQARYQECWFNLPEPVQADYIAAGAEAKTVERIVLYVAASVKHDAIAGAINRVLGKGEKGVGAAEAPRPYLGRWIHGGVQYTLGESDDGAQIEIVRARLEDPARYGLPESAQLIQSARANIVADDDAEEVLLVGIPGEGQSGFMQRLYLIVLDNADKADIVTPLPEDSGNGYGAEMLLRDFTGDALAEVFVRAGTGGSGGIYNGLIYSYAGGEAAKVFDTAQNTAPAYSGALVDGYKATLTLPAHEKTIALDLRGRKAQYDEAGVYTDGVLAKPTELWGEAYGWLAPVDKDEDTVFDLRVVQQVRATSNADRVAAISSVLTYAEGGWRVVESDVKPLPGD